MYTGYTLCVNKDASCLAQHKAKVIEFPIFQVVMWLCGVWHIPCSYKSKEMTKPASSPVRARRYPAECHPNGKVG